MQHATGTGSTTAACSATSARALASCTKASAACASCAASRTARSKLFTYGRSSGFCVDPIEKKPLNHFLPGTSVLSFGTAGCNLACKFCQNWDMSKSREMDTLADRATPRDARARRAAPRLRERRVHLQRSRRSSWSTRSTSREACRERGVQERRGHRGLHVRRTARRVLSPHGRGERRSEGLHRALLSQDLRRRTGRGARDARVPASTRRTCGSRSPRC